MTLFYFYYLARVRKTVFEEFPCQQTTQEDTLDSSYVREKLHSYLISKHTPTSMYRANMNIMFLSKRESFEYFFSCSNPPLNKHCFAGNKTV